LFEKRLIIGGLPRAGTTLLRVILDATPDYVAGPETAFFLRPLDEQKARLARTAARVDRALGLGEDVVARTILESRSSLACFDRLMELYATRAGLTKKGWAEKTPRNCLVYRELHDSFPELRFISMIRDGRDVVTSIVSGRTEYHVTIDRYVESLEAIYSFQVENHLVIRYEDLVGDTRRTLERVAAFAGTVIDERVIELSRQSSVTRDPTRVHQPKVQEPISTSWVGRWRDARHTDRINEFCAHAEAMRWLERTGYEAAGSIA